MGAHVSGCRAKTKYCMVAPAGERCTQRWARNGYNPLCGHALTQISYSPHAGTVSHSVRRDEQQRSVNNRQQQSYSCTQNVPEPPPRISHAMPKWLTFVLHILIPPVFGDTTILCGYLHKCAFFDKINRKMDLQKVVFIF